MRTFILLVIGMAAAACKLSVPSVYDVNFTSDPTATPVATGQVDEASGMADSRSQPGNVWIQQDSGNPPELILLGYDGKVKGKVTVPTLGNRDWEELAMGPGPKDGVNYLYICDIGDNDAQFQSVQIYRMPEPANAQSPIVNTQIDRINFRYPLGPRDAEAMFVDPQTKGIFVISKREQVVHLYGLAYPQNTSDLTTATDFGEIPNLGGGLANYVTGAAISPDGNEIIIRTYTTTYYWKRDKGMSIPDVLQYGTRRQLVTRVEPQGEAICFDKDAKGFFTISERASASSVNLYYYAKK